MAEPCATIIAASIPSLRGLFRDVRGKTTGKYNSPENAGYLRSTNSKFHVYSNNQSNPRRTANDTTELGETDANSDKSILGHPKARDGIERTMEVRVEYDAESRDTVQEAYEMQSPGGSRKAHARDVREEGRI